MGSIEANATPRSPWILASVAAVLIGALVLAVTLASRFGVDPDYVASAVIDREVPGLDLPRLGEDGTFDLGEQGGHITVVNFWASWCTACREEHDDLLLAARTYAPFGVQFVGIVYQDREANAMAFLDELGWGYEYVTDPGSRAAIAFGLRGVPETYFVNEEGIITARISGESTFAGLRAVLDGMIYRPSAISENAPAAAVSDGVDTGRGA